MLTHGLHRLCSTVAATLQKCGKKSQRRCLHAAIRPFRSKRVTKRYGVTVIWKPTLRVVGS